MISFIGCGLLQRLFCREEILRSIERLPEDQLESAVIPAGSSLTLPTDVIKGGSTLCWYFTITSGDVDFWITKEDFEVICLHVYLLIDIQKACSSLFILRDIAVCVHAGTRFDCSLHPLGQ